MNSVLCIAAREVFMKVNFGQRSFLLIAVLALSCFAGTSIFKVPINVSLRQFVCTGDYIWYLMPALGEKNSNYRIARLHVPSRSSKVFNSNDFGIQPSFKDEFEAPDSNHCAVLSESGDLAYFNGLTWKTLQNQSIKSLYSTKRGKILMNSDDYFGYIEKDSIILISRDSLGLSDDSIKAVASDNMENIYVINRHSVAEYNDSSWKVIFHNDSIKLNWISVLQDNAVYLQASGTTGSYFCKITDTGLVNYTIAEMESIRNKYSSYPTDASGNIWMLQKTLVGEELSPEMINGVDTVNSSNALASGWKNWPVFMNYDFRGCIISNKHVYIPIENGFYHYDGGPGRTWEWIPLNQTFDALGILGAQSLFQAADSSIYILSNYGFTVLNRYKDGKFYTFPYLTSNKICVDHEGVLWTQIDGYLCRFEKSFFKSVVLIPNIQQIVEDNTGRILVLSYNSWTYETQIFRETGTEWELFNQSNSNMPARDCVKMLQTSDGAYWVCTNGNGVAMSFDLHSWTKFDTTNSALPTNRINDIVLDHDGSVIVSCFGNGYRPAGVFKYSGGKWVNLGVPLTQRVGALNVDHYGKVWYGMAYYDGAKWNVVDDTLKLNDFVIDYSGKLWAYTDDKIYLTTNDEFYSFTTHAGFVKSNGKKSGKPPVFLRETTGDATVIDYNVDRPSNVTLSVFSMQGKLVAILKNGYLNSGSYSAVWNNNRAKGLYLLRYSSSITNCTVPIRIF